MTTLTIAEQIPGLRVGWVAAENAVIRPAGADLRQACEAAAEAARASGLAGGEPRRQAIRDLLRSGGFKPSGRSKPAQEYLLRTVLETGALPAISNAVDLINLVSLRSGLPISLVSLDRVGPHLELRFGRPGERYVFNHAGQELMLDGLLCLCAARGGQSTPVGTPVKDSMAAKVDETDRELLACFYASEAAATCAELQDWAGELAAGFRQFCQATAVTTGLLPG